MKRKRSLFPKNAKRERRLSLLSFLVGRVTLSSDACFATDILNVCMRYALPYGDLVMTEDGRISLSASYVVAKRLQTICRFGGIPITVDRSRGIREAMTFLVRRPGLPIGMMLCLALAVAFSTHLTEIRVTGNYTLSKSEVVSELSAAGLSLLDYVPAIDVDSIENRLLIRSEHISWITINLIGNVAEVQIREKTLKEEAGDTAPANLVARCDGVIVSCEVLHGNILTKAGEAVCAGEVLVSGVYDSLTQGIRYTRAEGAIYAETEHAFEIEVPYRYEKISYTGDSGTKYTLFFFGREIPFYESKGYDGENVVEHLSYIRVFGKDLPIGLSVETSHSLEALMGEYTRERAMELAYYKLSEEIAALPEMQGLLEKTVSYEIGDDAYTLYAKVRCIENIAETKNIEVELFD